MDKQEAINHKKLVAFVWLVVLRKAVAERTHRLCTRAGMLEKFLREPTLLTDDDALEFLTFLFHGEAAQRKLDMLIEKRKKGQGTSGSENLLF